MLTWGYAQNQEQTCNECGMPRREWRGNGGKGVRQDGASFCCESCPTGICMCSRFDTYGFVS